MSAQNTDLLQEVGLPGSATTLSAPGYTIGATSVNVGSTTNHPTATGYTFAIDVAEIVDGEQVRVDGTYNEFVGTVSNGTTITNVVQVFGDAQNYAAGALTRVYIPVSSERENRIVEWGTEEHNQDGTHSDVTASSIVASGDITAANFIQTGGAEANGWTVGLPAPNTVTNNGNRSYDLVFNADDITDTVSNGMRLKLTRTVTAPTQCTDLENGSSQYFSKTTPTGLTFTVTHTEIAWVKLESYTTGGVMARRNVSTEGWSLTVLSTGQVEVASLRIAANNSVTKTYQSLPLNEWTHIAAATDLAGTTLMYINGILVPSLTTVTGTAATLVQGTTALVVGSQQSAGANFFDGKIAQAAVFSVALTAATIRSYMSQGLSGSETSLVSAYSFNNSIVDLNANANNLSPQGSAVATDADSPFGLQADNTTTGTTEYAIITKTAFSTNTTLTVQVPEGNAIPTSGGVSAVSYSTQKAPYGFVTNADKWRLSSILRTNTTTTSNATYGAFAAAGWALSVPIGAFDVGWAATLASDSTTRVNFNVSSTALTGLTVTAGFDASPFAAHLQSAAAAFYYHQVYVRRPQTLTASATYVMYTLGTVTTSGVRGDIGMSEIFAEFNYL